VTEKFKSPLTGGRVKLIKEISTDHLVALYHSRLSFDVKPFLSSKSVQQFRCEETGYEFFEPSEVMGNPDFYGKLYGNADWAYSDTKWEYKVAGDFVEKGFRVLDVGSGGGQFLASVEAKERVGLETNKNGRDVTPAGIKTLGEVVEDHAISNAGHYDVVTAIQVLEHVYEVRTFIDSCLELLKSGGTLVLSVPNNGGFVGASELPLNMPPHHMGRWNRESLSSIASLFELELLTVEFEPLQESNISWYQNWMEERYLPQSKIAKSLYYRLGIASGIENWLRENRETLMGHTILAAYRKP